MYLITDTVTLMKITQQFHTDGENEDMSIMVRHHEKSETVQEYWTVTVKSGEVIGANTPSPFLATHSETCYFVNEKTARRYLAVADEFITWKSDGTMEKVNFRVDQIPVV